MDISGNLGDIMFQYNKNMRDYNDNMRIYLDIISNRDSSYNRNRYNYRYYYQEPLRSNNVFTPLFPRNSTLQDVVVRPTRRQIENATEIITFNETISNNNTNCPITLDPFVHGEQVCRIIHCSHLFKQTALNDWFRRNVRCPVCRYDIRDYVNENSERERERDREREVEVEIDEYNDENEYSEMVEELLHETIQNENQNQNQSPSTQTSFTRNLTTAIRGFINNELSNLPPSLNSVASELLYTFDIPLSFDVSGNIRI
jgi:hypothetical protein